MPNAPYYNGNTNPNAKGGAFGYDGRTGLGIGSLTKGPASGLGSNWNMGDALSSPKGQWDDTEEDYAEKQFKITSNTTVKELAAFAGLLDEEDYDELEADIEGKAHSSFHRGAVDSLSHRGTSIGYMGGIGSDMSAVIGLSAGKRLDGKVMSEKRIKQYIKQVLLNEKRLSTSSGRLATMSAPKAPNTGGRKRNDPLNIDKTSASTNTSDAAPLGHLPTSRSAFNYDGYTNNTLTPDNLEPYVKQGKATTDGGETTGGDNRDLQYKISAAMFNIGVSTGEDLEDSLDPEYIDQRNVDLQNINKFS